MSSARDLTALMRTPEGTDLRDGDPHAVYAYAFDGPVLHCMTEDLLDTWWRGLTPEEKAEAWERSLSVDDEAEVAIATLRNPLNALRALFPGMQ